MKILRLQAENIKRLVAVEITPSGNVVEITGKNGNGKTSVLDAIYFALGGNRVIQSKPVRDGEESGYCTLDLGDYKVTRKFKVKPDGEYTTSVVVENRDGFKAGNPQEVLNGLLGEFTFDPLAFSRMKAREQVVALRALVPGYDFAAADKANKDDADERTDVNRRAKNLRSQADGIAIPADAPVERIDGNALIAELEQAGAHNADIERQKSERSRMAAEIEAKLHTRDLWIGRAKELRDRIREIERQIAEVERDARLAGDTAAELQSTLDAMPGLPEPIDTADVRRKIDAAREANNHVEARERRDYFLAEAKAQEQRSDALSKAIDDRKAAAAKAVREAKLPVSGLEITEDAVLLNGQPFEQASDAEQLRVSIAVAGAMNPTLRVVRVRDGSLLDEDSMAALARYADENGLQVWIETVSSSRQSAIVIEDGMVASYREAAE